MSSNPETLLLPVLRQMAEKHLKNERRDHTLQPTALVNEAWLILAKQRGVSPRNRTTYLAAAAKTMRRILIDHARGKNAQKRGGEFQRIPLHSLELGNANKGMEQIDLLALEDLLEELAKHNERAERVVELRFFGGLEYREIAEQLGISLRAAKGDWTFARTWLLRGLSAK